MNTPSYGWDGVLLFQINFTLASSSSVLRVWNLVDTTLGDSGHHLRVDTSGTLRMYQTVGGAAVEYGSAATAFTITPGVEYTVLVSQNGAITAGSFPLTFQVWETALGSGAGVTVAPDGVTESRDLWGSFQAPPSFDWNAHATHNGNTSASYGALWFAATVTRYYGLTTAGDTVDFNTLSTLQLLESAAPDYLL